eukprot:TRINITY_DN6224_c0_g1_i3.p1 TRINITY_DN6224_c0_g1~~TRINITY_DN6224_c0_g1_i3.p1  ORF type:complete len:338 (-),score=60.14 TRINITY_DN6224_c0_g1_i3:647-1660(-)
MVYGQQVRVGVIGAGVIGLGTAANVLKKFPNADVHIIADKFQNQTTSWGSGGLWKPHDIGDTPQEKVYQWSKKTFEYFDQINKTITEETTGIIPVPLVQYWTENADPSPPFWADIAKNFRMLEKDEMKQGFSGAVSGWTLDTFAADNSYYMPWLTRFLESQGCQIKQGRVDQFDDLAGEGYDVIVNCMGISAKDVVSDESVFPIRGQLVQVKAPDVRTSYFIDTDCYVIPHIDKIVLGGTRQKDNWSLENSEDEVNSILKNVQQILPQIQDSDIIDKWAGLRPSRTQVRLETEIRKLSDGSDMKIVHNYGHGAWGVTLHWGCGQEASELVASLLENK